MTSEDNTDLNKKDTKKNNPKKSKKDKLSNALKREADKSGISGFVNEMKKNKEQEDDDMKPSPVIETAHPKELLREHLGEEGGMGVHTKKIVLTLGAILILTYFYFQFFSAGSSTRGIYLSSQPILTSQLPVLGSKPPVFSRDNPVYVHFSMGSELGVDKIHIKILNETDGSTGLVGEVAATVKPHWKHIQTHFQEEFFEEAGKYKIQISKSDGVILAKNIFDIE